MIYFDTTKRNLRIFTLFCWILIKLNIQETEFLLAIPKHLVFKKLNTKNKN